MSGDGEGGAVRGDSLGRRLAVTGAVTAAVLAAGHLRLPQIDPDAYREVVGWYGSLLSPLAIGMVPFLFGFVLVEFAATVVPRWRALRDGSVSDRAALTRAAWTVALAVAAFQAWGTTLDLASLRDLRGDPLIAHGWLPALSVAATLTVGTFAVGALAVLISRKGLGNGFAVLFAAWGVEALTQAGFRALLGPRDGWSDVSLLVLLAVAVVLPLVVARRRRERGSGPSLVPIPTCSLVVLQLRQGVLELIYVVAGWLALDAQRIAEWLSAGRWRWISIALVVAVSVPLARLFFPRGAVEATWQRAGLPGPGAGGVLEARRALRMANLGSLALVTGIAALPLIAAELGAGDVPSGDLVVEALIVVAVARDLVGEWRGRRSGGRLAAVRPLQRAYAVEPALRALAAAGITGFARARHYRALFHFFAPYAPIEILVPPDRAAEADAICARVVVGAAV